jgi:hypothetical protein
VPVPRRKTVESETRRVQSRRRATQRSERRVRRVDGEMAHALGPRRAAWPCIAPGRVRFARKGRGASGGRAGASVVRPRGWTPSVATPDELATSALRRLQGTRQPEGCPEMSGAKVKRHHPLSHFASLGASLLVQPAPIVASSTYSILANLRYVPRWQVAQGTNEPCSSHLGLPVRALHCLQVQQLPVRGRVRRRFTRVKVSFGESCDVALSRQLAPISQAAESCPAIWEISRRDNNIIG